MLGRITSTYPGLALLGRPLKYLHAVLLSMFRRLYYLDSMVVNTYQLAVGHTVTAPSYADAVHARAVRGATHPAQYAMLGRTPRSCHCEESIAAVGDFSNVGPLFCTQTNHCVP